MGSSSRQMMYCIIYCKHWQPAALGPNFKKNPLLSTEAFCKQTIQSSSKNNLPLSQKLFM